jgi:hypothetical protein
MSQPVCPGPTDLVSRPRTSERGTDSEALSRRYAGRRGLPPPHVSQPKKIAGNCRRNLRKVSFP